MINDFWMFALATLLMNLTPGNDVLYIVSRSTEQGVKAGVLSAMGIACGCLVHVTAAAAGLSTIIASSVMAFDIIRYVGAAYLLYLGMRTLFNRKKTACLPMERPVQASYSRLFWQGALTNILNPKVALFFLAFLPQFVDIRGLHVWESILLLGMWFNISGTVVNSLYAILFGRIGEFLRQSPRWLKVQERVTGVVLIALGLKVAFTSKK